jgi:hypothetical protein
LAARTSSEASKKGIFLLDHWWYGDLATGIDKVPSKRPGEASAGETADVQLGKTLQLT